jgi:hypothetical protein
VILRRRPSVVADADSFSTATNCAAMFFPRGARELPD